jgi:hypothetical protein
VHLRVRGRTTIVAGYSVFRRSPTKRAPAWRSRAYVPASAVVFDIVGTGGRVSALLFVGHQFPGGHRSRVTPVPIPNTEVKPVSADGTACVSAWESRSLPGLFAKPDAHIELSGFSLYAPATRAGRPAIFSEDREQIEVLSLPRLTSTGCGPSGPPRRAVAHRAAHGARDPQDIVQHDDVDPPSERLLDPLCVIVWLIVHRVIAWDVACPRGSPSPSTVLADRATSRPPRLRRVPCAASTTQDSGR